MFVMCSVGKKYVNNRRPYVVVVVCQLSAFRREKPRATGNKVKKGARLTGRYTTTTGFHNEVLVFQRQKPCYLQFAIGFWSQNISIYPPIYLPFEWKIITWIHNSVSKAGIWELIDPRSISFGRHHHYDIRELSIAGDRCAPVILSNVPGLKIYSKMRYD